MLIQPLNKLSKLIFYAVPVFSLTIPLRDLIREKINTPPINAAITRIQKKTDFSVKLSQKLAMIPAAFPPSAVERNQPPIISAVVLAGASLDTRESPIGLRKSSLIVKTP